MGIPNSPYRYSGPPPAEKGDRIELRRMASDDPDPIPPGTRGTVAYCLKQEKRGGITEWDIGVDWDNGRKLGLVHPVDTFMRIPHGWDKAG